jgi:hypothetical protein
MRVCAQSWLVVIAILAAPEAGFAQADEPTASRPTSAEKPPIHPEADRLLRATSQTLSRAKDFSFKAEVWDDQVVGGHKVATSKTVEMRLRRPDSVQAEVRSPKRNRAFWYDGKSFTMLDRKKNLYGTAPISGSIDKFVDTANDQFGISFPLEDIMVNDPYASIMPAVQGGAYFGKTTVLGTPCQHIAFSTQATDWQLWVEEGKALPRKLVITYKLEKASPQYTAIFSDWKLDQKLGDDLFAFKAPNEAKKIEILPGQRKEEMPEGVGGAPSAK